jgi:GDPmannose 4,6-dehydratase
MNKKTAIVTGITGQDGPYLARLLLEKDYKVYGLCKGQSSTHLPPNLENLSYLGIDNHIELVFGDVSDESSINHLIKTIRPDEFYNLAAQSFVGASWNLNKLTTEVNAIGPLNILNSIKQHSVQTRFYQASTSEIFGSSKASPDARHDEQSSFRPRNPYGSSKLFAHWLTINFRESHGVYASNGILFNHESPIRGIDYVTRKISDGVAKIKLGLADSITLGDLSPMRDWGYAGDYAEAMWLMLQLDTPDDFVIATGELHSISDFLRIAFEHAGISAWKKYVKSDPRFKRPTEIFSLCGNAKKAETILGWRRKVQFNELVKMMVDADIERYTKQPSM